MVALSMVRHGVALALAAALLCSGHDLRLHEPGFPVGTDEKEELTCDFTTAAEAIVMAKHAGDVVLLAFFEP